MISENLPSLAPLLGLPVAPGGSNLANDRHEILHGRSTQASLVFYDTLEIEIMDLTVKKKMMKKCTVHFEA
ncbi:hypothetical protein RRG08_032976 [Elysia crispata]|uniref:Uncharacterized protein n=1 Tax=Elysia crispata TaxID=231223 RepID=A0AAE0YRV0_9GAST|nr:hypothetical protein RRG08_032976 [Elysia crispata]